MDINDLKSAWDRYSSQEMDKHRLGKDSIHELLKTRTITMVERFNRNIRIGLVILGAYLIYVILDYLFLSAFLSKMIIHKTVEYPKWLEPVDVFSTVLIITTYLFFVLRYLKIKRSFSIDHHLKDLLAGILETIKTYRRMFYLAVIILLINIVLSFSAGLYLGIISNTVNFPNGFENLSVAKLFGIIGIGLAFLTPLVLFTFFILRWGFNKLYGRYMLQIQETIQELEEPEIQ
ncbi:MAG: hypothetical protein WAO52_11570 [Prolixibacteraceae bacterium]